MGTLTELQAALMALKGEGRWSRIAKGAGCTYDTLARIARGDIPNPGILTCERLFAAIKATAVKAK
jgi:hypothetical protein